MILIYTGKGKGKTCACVGQALRAHGQGLRVGFCQFMKRPGQSGEQEILTALLGSRFFAGGQGFFRREEERDAQRVAALTVLERARDLLESTELLVLDESLYALGCGLLREEELRDLCESAARAGRHLVLSGRGLPDWLEGMADVVTEMVEIRHPHASGHGAVRGIEF